MIIWGFRTKEVFVAAVTITCQRCGSTGAHRIVKWVRKFTLFFIPLFTTSTQYVGTCTNCGLQQGMTVEAGKQLEATVAASGQGAPIPLPQPSSGSPDFWPSNDQR